MDLGSILDSSLTGGLFGLLGNVTNKVIGIFTAKQEFAQKKEEWGHEERLLDMQMKAKAAETEQELAVTASSGSWSGLGESLKAETAVGASYPWVNAVRALVRPALTAGLGGSLRRLLRHRGGRPHIDLGLASLRRRHCHRLVVWRPGAEKRRLKSAAPPADRP